MACRYGLSEPELIIVIILLLRNPAPAIIVVIVTVAAPAQQQGQTQTYCSRYPHGIAPFNQQFPIVGLERTVGGGSVAASGHSSPR